MKKRLSSWTAGCWLISLIWLLASCDYQTEEPTPYGTGPENSEIQGLAEELAYGGLNPEEYAELLYTDENFRGDLRNALTGYLDEEEIINSQPIFAVVGPPPGAISNGGNFELPETAKQEFKQTDDGYWIVQVDVPFYSQNDPLWANNSLGYNYDGTSTIGKYGCHLCCISMLYAKWGYPEMSPPGLNNWSLSGQDHYAFSPYFNGDLIWMTQALEYPGICRPWYYINYNQIWDHLNADQPVVAKVWQYNTVHFVVIFAHNGERYWVKDPAQPAATQNQWLSEIAYNYRVYGYP